MQDIPVNYLFGLAAFFFTGLGLSFTDADGSTEAAFNQWLYFFYVVPCCGRRPLELVGASGQPSVEHCRQG